MGRSSNTKDLFVFEALKLFSERGYDAVKVSDIAKEVGCTAPALYKHFKSKQQLYDAILAESNKGYAAAMEQLNVDFAAHPERRSQYLAMTEEDEIKMVQKLFLHPLRDPWASAFRKLMTLEQYRRPDLARMYNERYVTLQYEHYRALFEMLMAEGLMKSADPFTLAVMFVSPIIALFDICDREPEKESWALETLRNHVIEFNKAYRIRRRTAE
ncbi:MAG: TetR/AcrR family transcriptional regulator [Clostridia bacterium]|nr:TetR/AcrR family transcriptional regulator [Clostridia bacterium]